MLKMASILEEDKKRKNLTKKVEETKHRSHRISSSSDHQRKNDRLRHHRKKEKDNIKKIEKTHRHKESYSHRHKSKFLYGKYICLEYRHDSSSLESKNKKQRISENVNKKTSEEEILHKEV